MSEVERACFWPATQESYSRPSTDSRNTWQLGLHDVKLYLTSYRPSKLFHYLREVVSAVAL